MVIRQRKLRKIEDESWKVIPGSNNRYFASNYGRIKSFSTNKKDGQILKLFEIKGFKTVHIVKDGSKSTLYVHKLVAEAWIPKALRLIIELTSQSACRFLTTGDPALNNPTMARPASSKPPPVSRQATFTRRREEIWLRRSICLPFTAMPTPTPSFSPISSRWARGPCIAISAARKNSFWQRSISACGSCTS